MIRNHPDWIFAGVFFDVETGVHRNGRTGLDKMLKKAAKGKIDYIITKSISRVSRDTTVYIANEKYQQNIEGEEPLIVNNSNLNDFISHFSLPRSSIFLLSVDNMYEPFIMKTRK